jgi:molybdopterin/thiamine biosynthesis adenylyltransferase
LTRSTPGAPEDERALAHRASVYRPAEASGARAVARLRADPSIQVLDTIDAQIEDLLRTRRPGARPGAEELAGMVESHLGGAAPDDYGVWAFYPWSRRLVHLLDEPEFVELRTNRTRNKITPAEQELLSGRRVGIVGLSVGQAVALTIALERGAGEIRLADHDVLDLSNLNRIRAGVHEIGLPKTVIAARAIAAIDPFLKVSVFSEGLTEDNVGAFLLGGGRLDVLIDECDSMAMKFVARYRARAERVPVLMETSDRGMIDVERFDLEPGRPVLHGRAGEPDPGELRSLSPARRLELVTSIVGPETLSSRARASLAEVGRTLATWPQLASAVMQGGGVTAAVARRILLGEEVPSGRYFVDADEIVS